MKKNLIYGWMVLSLGVAMTGCSNLDESIAKVETVESNTIYSETFATGLGKFTTKSVTGNQVWSPNSSSYVMMTGYENSVNNANEDWLISPEIDLSNQAVAHLSFDHVARYFADVANEATIWISENYKNDSLPASATWKQVKTNPFSDPGNWTLSTSGEISLTAYAGKKIRVAFKYISTATKAGTWEIKNFLVEKGEAKVDASLIYSEPFVSTLGQFTQQSVSGTQVWAADSHGYAMMTGYVSPTNFANEDWLISPSIDLSGVTTAHFSFDHVTRYFANLTTEATVMISTDYVDGLPSTGTWTPITTNPFFDPGSYTFGSSQEISLTAYAGKKVRIAFKYISTATKAGTWELKNFQVYSGEAKGIEIKPYTVKDAIASQTGGLAWVQGYIVGYAWPYLTQNTFTFAADTCSQTTNVLIADTVGTNLYASRCVAVQLPRGSIRNGLNLKNNKSVIGKKVKVYGTLSNNMGIAGLINTAKYSMAGGDVIASTTTIKYSETLLSGLGAFTQTSVSGDQVWAFASGYGAKMSGYTTVNNVNEDWLYSPEIDLTTLTSAALSFEHTINKGVVANMRTEQTLWISTDNGTTWAALAIPTYPAGNSWTYVSSGEINLDPYAGKKVKFAFKYISTAASSATWEIKNFKIFY